MPRRTKAPPKNRKPRKRVPAGHRGLTVTNVTTGVVVEHPERDYSSKQWQAVRDARRAIDNEKCQVPGCGALRELHVHHRRYTAPFGKEPMTDLVTLCEFHHAKVHKIHNNLTKQFHDSLNWATEKVLKR